MGAVLWVLLGAVAGARYWQMSGGAYLLGVTVVGAMLGLAWPGRHLVTGLLLVSPGLAMLLGAGIAEEQPDLAWWLLTLAVGCTLASGAHFLSAWGRALLGDRRRRRRRMTALGGQMRRHGLAAPSGSG